MPSPRFYVQEPHSDGLAVIDRELGTMVISSFGDTAYPAKMSLDAVAAALNAATDPSYPYATNEFKRSSMMHPTLVGA